MAHSELSLKDIPSINVIIGKNDTGKTGLLKLLYATVKSLEIYSLKYLAVNKRGFGFSTLYYEFR